jgi:hypothetical protein
MTGGWHGMKPVEAVTAKGSTNAGRELGLSPR